ncbi:MAG: NAD(P)-dependent glycerol-3-phosphate dehydrogenase [Chloroflexota bacterium]|nr:NAD(P)-dependent glycerol-3-phosphate dehydrogenase [Chloroflexota bacterium]
MKVTVIGSGAWGTTLCGVAADAGSEVTLVARNPTVLGSLRDERRHPFSVPGYRLPDAVRVVPSVTEGLAASPDLVVMVVPSSAVEAAAGEVEEVGYRGLVVTATKGIDPGSLKTPAARVAAVRGIGSPVAVLSGPNLAGEVASGLPAAAVIAAESEEVASSARSALMSSRFRIYTSRDVTGVEIAGAFKNVIAIGAGISDGLDAGQNAKAAYVTRGIAEMARLGLACGADVMTFAGLAGIGDLMATCNSERSRNHTVGRGLAAGRSLGSVLADLKEVAEGVQTTRAVLDLAKVKGVELPIASQIARILFEGVSPQIAIADLMARDATSEMAFLEGF